MPIAYLPPLRAPVLPATPLGGIGPPDGAGGRGRATSQEGGQEAQEEDQGRSRPRCPHE